MARFLVPLGEGVLMAASNPVVPERVLTFRVVCQQCRGGWLWKFREEWPAGEAARAHVEWSGHVVEVVKV